MRIQPESGENPAIEQLWALAVHQVRRNLALRLFAIAKLAWRRTQLKIFRRPAIAQWLSPAVHNCRRCERSSPKVAVRCNSSVAAKLAPTTKLQADHAAFGDIALSLVFGPRVG